MHSLSSLSPALSSSLPRIQSLRTLIGRLSTSLHIRTRVVVFCLIRAPSVITERERERERKKRRAKRGPPPPSVGRAPPLCRRFSCPTGGGTIQSRAAPYFGCLMCNIHTTRERLIRSIDRVARASAIERGRRPARVSVAARTKALSSRAPPFSQSLRPQHQKKSHILAIAFPPPRLPCSPRARLFLALSRLPTFRRRVVFFFQFELPPPGTWQKKPWRAARSPRVSWWRYSWSPRPRRPARTTVSARFCGARARVMRRVSRPPGFGGEE